MLEGSKAYLLPGLLASQLYLTNNYIFKELIFAR